MLDIENPKTTIAISRKTRTDLAAIASKDQTFDEILKILINKWNEKC